MEESIYLDFKSDFIPQLDDPPKKSTPTFAHKLD